jgi:hypothetical protein
MTLVCNSAIGGGILAPIPTTCFSFNRLNDGQSPRLLYDYSETLSSDNHHHERTIHEDQRPTGRMNTVGPSVIDTRGPSLSRHTTKSTMVLYINLRPRTDRHDGGLVEWLTAAKVQRYTNELHYLVTRVVYYK